MEDVVESAVEMGMNVRSDGPSLATLPLHTLLNYLRKDDILDHVLPPNVKQEIEALAVREKKRLTKGLIKKWIAEQDLPWQSQLGNFIRESQYGRDAYKRYVEAVARLKDPANKEKSKLSRKVAADAKKGFLGCLATKSNAKHFTYCSENFDNPEFAFDIVPPAVRSNALARAGLQEHIPHPRHISYLPVGLRQYMSKNPMAFEDYLEERKTEVAFLNSVKRNLLNAIYSGQSSLTIDLPKKASEDDVQGKKRKKAAE